MSHSFTELLERARDGDAEARGELLQRNGARLRAFVRLKSGRLIRARESCSDLVQSVCREALDDLGELQCATEDDFVRWLERVAFHKIQHKVEYHQAQRRDAARQVPLEGDATEGGVLDVYGSFCTPSRDAVVREELDRIEAAFDRLPDDYREVIVLARIDGLTHAEIAAETGRSEVAVRKLLSRARARLALLLDGSQGS